MRELVSRGLVLSLGLQYPHERSVWSYTPVVTALERQARRFWDFLARK